MDNNILREKFESLPEVLKDAITSVDFATNLESIGKMHGLHIDELDKLLGEVGLVILGETSVHDFKSKLAKSLSLTEEKIEPIVSSVDSKIFQSIRSALEESANKKKMAPPQEDVKPLATSPDFVKPKENTSDIAEADYNMSRDAILSEIEHPRPPEVRGEYVAKRSVESKNPEEYLKTRKSASGFLVKPSTPSGKPSLAAEAMFIAEKKATTEKVPEAKTSVIEKQFPENTSAEQNSDKEKKVFVSVPPKTPQQNMPSPVIPNLSNSSPVKRDRPIMPGVAINPVTPTTKLAQITQNPSLKIDTTPIIQKNGPDPYREPI